MVGEKGIAYHPEHQIARAEEHRVAVTDGKSVDFDLLVYMPPIRPPRPLSGSGLVDDSGSEPDLMDSAWRRFDERT